MGIWDLDDLKKEKKNIRVPGFDTSATEIDVGTGAEPEGEAIPDSAGRLEKARAIIERIEKKPKGEAVVITDPNPIVSEIRVYPWETEYVYHKRFREDAKKYARLKHAECEFAAFFSASPMYTQLKPEQMNYYLYWRYEARRGRYLKTELAYIMLFVAEIVNLPDLINPEYGIGWLCRIYENYCGKYSSTMRLMPTWICDYCVINGVRPTESYLSVIRGKYLSIFPEVSAFYNGLENGVDCRAAMIYAVHGRKNWQTARAVGDEQRPVFDKIVPSACVGVLSEAEKANIQPFGIKTRPVFRENESNHAAYTGLVCAYECKRNITMRYKTVSRSPDLGLTVGLLEKLAENKVRALLGIKSRYHVSELNDSLKELLESWFERNCTLKKEEKKPQREEYERLYDAEITEISVSDAVRIEFSGRAITELLTSDIEIDEEPITEEKPEAGAENNADTVRRVLAALLGKSDETLGNIAKECGMLEETLIQTVNEAMFDTVGDSVIIDGKIEDYREEAEEFLNG